MSLSADVAANRGDLRALVIVLSFRLASAARARLPRPLALPVIAVYKLVVAYLMGVDIPAKTKIGPGLRLQHAYAVVIHPDTRIGANCRINQCVTVGVRVNSNAPLLGDNVAIGSGAQVLGSVTLGDGAVIGAGATVVHDVPSGHVAIGPSATVRPTREFLQTQRENESLG